MRLGKSTPSFLALIKSPPTNMKIFSTAASALLLTATFASAGSNLFLDLGPLTASGGSLTNDPAHATGAVSLSQTSWNTISSSSDFTSAVYSDGTSATGVTIDFGQSAAAGTSINFATAIGNVALKGTGGAVAGQQSFLGASSIYGSGNNDSNTAVGRDGFLGSTNTAIGMRIDGLTAGNYTLYIMARQVSSNAVGSLPMNLYTATGASAGTFDFSALTPTVQTNTNYASAGYAGQYNVFTAGENYVAINVTVGAGQSLFIASDGGGAELRGFINSIQIVAVPEPSAYAAGMLGFLALVTIVRRQKRA